MADAGAVGMSVRIDLAVPAGSFFGLVGPNGAGKTTSLSMAVGLLRPDGGTVRIFGRDVWADPVAAKTLIGVLPDGMALPDRLSGREVLVYLGLLRGMPREVVAERADELLQVLELDGAEGTAVVDYSTGMRKKITLATALLHNPRLLLLDEPFEAVDPVSAATVRTILQRFVARGGSVIFVAPAGALLAAGTVTHDVALRWLAVPVALAWGAFLCWRSVRLAQQRLERQGPEIFARARAPVS
jgi:ABC-2 type transport system ATP-binding protein